MEIPSYLHKSIIYENPPNVKHGAEAIVFKGTLPSVKGDIAIKQWSHTLRDEDEKQRVRREVTLLMQNRHENIIQFLGILIDEQSKWIGYVMPYMKNGSLDEIIHNKNKNYDDIYTDEQIKRWAVKICCGLSHLHSKNIIHRDIKPSKLGNPLYMAPEISKDEEYYISADIYSLSITIWEILHRRKAFNRGKFSSRLEELKFLKEITDGKRPELNSNLSKDVSDLLTRCWHADASKRPPIDEVRECCENTTFSLSASSFDKPNENFDISQAIETSPEKQTILLLGGDDGKNKDSLLMLENNEEKWKPLNIKLPYAIRSHGAQFLNNYLYIFGGGNASNNPINSTYKLSKSLKWEKIVNMNEKRCHISNSSVILNNRIWVCGGQDEKYGALSSVEMYDPLKNKWKYMKQMNQCRSSAAAAVINEKIFCSGGWMCNSVEYYDPFSNVWTSICDIPGDIYAHGAVGIDGNFIVVGGYDGKESLKNVWVLDIIDKNAKWIEKQPMYIPRYGFSIAKLDGKIFSCGGQSKQDEKWKPTDLVEIFDGEVWRHGPKMPTPRTYAPAVAISMAFLNDLLSNINFRLEIMPIKPETPKLEERQEASLHEQKLCIVPTSNACYDAYHQSLQKFIQNVEQKVKHFNESFDVPSINEIFSNSQVIALFNATMLQDVAINTFNEALLNTHYCTQEREIFFQKLRESIQHLYYPYKMSAERYEQLLSAETKIDNHVETIIKTAKGITSSFKFNYVLNELEKKMGPERKKLKRGVEEENEVVTKSAKEIGSPSELQKMNEKSSDEYIDTLEDEERVVEGLNRSLWTSLKSINQSTTADVTHATNKESYCLDFEGTRAVKRWKSLRDLKKNKNQCREHMLREIFLLKKIRNHPIECPHIVTIHEYLVDYSEGKQIICGFTMEYMENLSLHNVMYKQEIPYDLEHVYNWMYQAASGLEFLHVQLNHMHRDVKPANMLLSQNFEILKMCDLEGAKDIHETPHTLGGVGTPGYAPRRMALDKLYGLEVDVFELGQSIHEVFLRKKPNEDTGNLVLDESLKGKDIGKLIQECWIGHEMVAESSVNEKQETRKITMTYIKNWFKKRQANNRKKLCGRKATVSGEKAVSAQQVTISHCNRCDNHISRCCRSFDDFVTFREELDSAKNDMLTVIELHNKLLEYIGKL